MQTQTLQPKLQDAVDVIVASVTEANDAVVLAQETLERTNLDVRAATDRLRIANEDVEKAKKTEAAIVQRISERTKGYKETLQKHADTTQRAEAEATKATKALELLLSQLKGAKKALSDAQTAKKTVDTEYQGLLGKITAANDQLRDLNADIGEKTTEQGTLTKAVRKLESRQATLIEEIKTLETQKSDAQADKEHELKVVIATIRDRRTELGKVEKKIEQFNEYMAIETKTLEAKQRQIERDTADLNDEKRKVKSDRSLLTPLS